jgi:hypothetical protein
VSAKDLAVVDDEDPQGNAFPVGFQVRAVRTVCRQSFWDRKGDFRREGFGSSMRLTGESFGFACGVGKPENRVCLLGRVS